MTKKLIAIFIAVTCVTTVFAVDVAFPVNTVTDVRSYGLGGPYVTDYSDYYTLYRNPAFLGKAGKHSLFDLLTLRGFADCDLKKVIDLVKNFDSLGEDSNALINEISACLGDNGLNAGLDLSIPFLSFGGTSAKGFGWGFYNTITADVKMPSTKATVRLLAELGLTFGYGTSFKLPLGLELSVGGSVTGYAQVPKAALRGGLTQILSATSGDGDIMDLAGVMVGAGVSTNLGLGLTFINFIEVGAVYKNLWSPTWGSDIDLKDIDFSNIKLESGDKLPAKLAVGVGVDLSKIISTVTFHIIPKTKIYLNHSNILDFTDKLARNPVLGVGVGAEVNLIKVFDLRAGLSEGYLHAGVGLNLGPLNIDLAMFGMELSSEPGQLPVPNAALSITIQK